MNELLGYVQQLMQYIEANAATLNTETQQELAVFLQEVWQFIEQMQAQNPVETLPPQPQQPIPPIGPSSNVAGMQYDPRSKNMVVQFLGKYPNREGPVYQYDNIPREIVDLLQKGAIPASTKGQNKWGAWYPGKVPSFGASVYRLLNQSGANYHRVR